MKTINCTLCKKEKDVSEFYKSQRHKLGYIPSCKECESLRHLTNYDPKNRKQNYMESKEKYLVNAKIYAEKNKEKIRQQKKDYYQNNKLMFLEAGWKKKGILNKNSLFFKQQDFNELFEIANYSCQICKKADIKHKKGFVVDHCHKTNYARGILCANCNIALGCFRDSIEHLNNAIKYLTNAEY